jgi:uncharacterized integral membrane protein
MGDKDYFQPLTREDRITVIIYRAGILISALLLACTAAVAVWGITGADPSVLRLGSDILILSIYFSTGLSVFFIHLYIGKFHRALKKAYYLAAACLAVLFLLGKGSPSALITGAATSGAMLLIPLSLCLGFVTAKEAFCFRLTEGYLLALLMPASLFFYGTGLLDVRKALILLSVNAGLFVIFTLRKIFMPIHYDIGDKSAYQP